MSEHKHSIRAKEEIKSITKSIRLTEAEYETIQNQAKQSGMKETEYMRHVLKHGTSDTVTPQERVKLQNLMNAVHIILEQSECPIETIKEFERRCDEIW